MGVGGGVGGLKRGYSVIYIVLEVDIAGGSGGEYSTGCRGWGNLYEIWEGK